MERDWVFEPAVWLSQQHFSRTRSLALLQLLEASEYTPLTDVVETCQLFALIGRYYVVTAILYSEIYCVGMVKVSTLHRLFV